MFELIKQRVIKNLIEEIECISATNLELVGNNVVSMDEDKRMIHHGINKDYKPSGYTVDTFSNDSKIIAEYSTDADFFKDSSKKDDLIPFFEKVENDISHAIAHAETADKIYLISSRQEPPSFRSKFNKTSIAKDYGEKTIIYDSRELAKLIYKQSCESTDAASFYKQFFPGFSQDLDNYAYYGKVPSFCEKHLKHDNAIAILNNHFKGNDVCVLEGISGSGKTQIAIEYLHSEKVSFENYLWISGDDWKENASFSSIQRSRGGAPVNVSGLFNSYKTLLIIDDLNRVITDSQLLELTDGFAKGSKLLITSQLSKPNDPIYLPVPELPYELACQIIGEEPGKEPGKSRDVITLCKSCPLILATIRNLVEEGNLTRSELYDEVLSSPNDIADNNGRSIMGRILGKLEPAMLAALKLVSNSGSSIHDSVFLKCLIGAIQRSNLQRLSILLPANVPGFLKIHDLVYSSVQDNIAVKEVSSAIDTYVSSNNASMSPSMIRQIHLCYDVLLQGYDSFSQKKLSWTTYAILQVEGNKKKELQESIYTIDIDKSMELCPVLCLIDAKEAHIYSIEKQYRHVYFEKCIQEYNKALELVSDDRIKIELLHHLGKTYRRCNLPKEALVCFKTLLSINPDMHATFLQIASLGAQPSASMEVKEEGGKYLEKLFDCIFYDYSIVPLRVSLAAIAKLRSYKTIYNKFNSNTDQVKKIANIICLSSFEGFGQFFEAFVSFTSMFGYHHSSECLNLIEQIPELTTISVEDIEENHWLNALEGLTNLAISASRQNKDQLCEKIANASLPFADKTFEKQELTSYQARALAKTYTFVGMAQKALLSINKVPVESHDHWLVYQKSRAELHVEPTKAYESAKIALALALEDHYVESRISIYYDLLSQCAEQIGNKEEAITQAKVALEKCTDEKFKIELNARFSKLGSNN